jgi:hypothetical protein
MENQKRVAFVISSRRILTARPTRRLGVNAMLYQTSLRRPDAYLCSRLEISV